MTINKTMKKTIGFIFCLFTIVQLFYLVQIPIVPTHIVSTEQIVKGFIYVLETILSVGAVTLLTYVLPFICVISFNIKFIEIKKVKRIKTKQYNLYNKIAFSNDTYQVLQVIRC